MANADQKLKRESRIGDWNVKIKVWQCLARTPNNLSAVRRELELHAGDEGYPEHAPDKYTIKKKREELATLSAGLVSTLSPEVQAYAQELNPQLRLEHEQEPYVGTPQKREVSLTVSGFSPGETDVEFFLSNESVNSVVVDRVYVEVIHWEHYDGPLTTGARIIDHKYEVELKPKLGEILVSAEDFKIPGNDTESFSFYFTSPPGKKYKARINFYCIEPKNHSFRVSTDEFEIRFRKSRIVSGEGKSPPSNTIAEARKLIAKSKKGRTVTTDKSQTRFTESDTAGTEGMLTASDAIALAQKIIVDEAKKRK